MEWRAFLEGLGTGWLILAIAAVVWAWRNKDAINE